MARQAPIARELFAASEVPAEEATASRTRILVLLETTTLTGIARGVLGFHAAAPRCLRLGPLDTHILISARGATLEALLAKAALHAGAGVSILREDVRFDPRAVLHLQQLCARFRPHIVQTHAVKSHVLAWVAGIRRRHVWVAFHHGYTHTDAKMRAYNTLDYLTLRHADHVITVAEAFRRELSAAGVAPGRLTVLRNAVPALRGSTEEQRQQMRDTLGLTSGARLVTAIGRLSREKAHEDLIRAFAITVAKIPTASLVIAGRGPERDRLIRVVNRLGLTNCVKLPGQMEDVEALYALSEAVVLSSTTEGCPSVVLEAMAAGVPVVSTCVGGMPEIVAHGETGLLVPAGDAEALSDAITRVLLDRPLAERLASTARERVVERHDPLDRAARLAALQSRLIAARRRGSRLRQQPRNAPSVM